MEEIQKVISLICLSNKLAVWTQLHKQHMISRIQLEHEFLAKCSEDWVHV